MPPLCACAASCSHFCYHQRSQSSSPFLLPRGGPLRCSYCLGNQGLSEQMVAEVPAEGRMEEARAEDQTIGALAAALGLAPRTEGSVGEAAAVENWVHGIAPPQKGIKETK
eukprot:TRINITY_DN1937_c0_g1_i2.p1 TRINITY_DN1937_c0_g1~~TRINITY_DN1937_c0_g1_i2.p1  ORF type:complete len:111 (+),score=14.31 TRINITY_DN1937_c0_g1_i2:94-426(+)